MCVWYLRHRWEKKKCSARGRTSSLAPTMWIKHESKPYKLVQAQLNKRWKSRQSKPFFRDTQILNICTGIVWAPVNPLTNGVFRPPDNWPLFYIFGRPVSGRCFFFARLLAPFFFVLLTPNSRWETKTKLPSLTDRQGLMEHVCKYHGLYLKNGVDFWTLVRKACVICVVVLVSIWDQLWALNQTWHWPYAVRSSNICTKLSHTCLGVPGIGSSRKKNGDKIYLIT